MPRGCLAVVVILSIFIAGCASAPGPAVSGGAPAAPVETATPAATELSADGPRPRWVQPNWWDDHPGARIAAAVGVGVAVGVVVTVAVLAVAVVSVARQIH